MAGAVLFVMQSMFETVYAHIGRFLEERGYRVDTLVVAGDTERESHPTCPTDAIFADRAFVRRCRGRYDAIVFCIHCHNHPRMKRFQKRVSLRLGYIFLEHDLLSPGPDTERGIRSRTLGVVCFQKKHQRALTRAGYRVVMARWNKLDADYPAYEMADARPWEDAVLIGSSHPVAGWRLAKEAEFEYPGLFRTVWYKPWNVSDFPVKRGTVRLPPVFESPHGGKYCADIAKFHLTCGSSSYLDALLFGCVPIMYFPRGGGPMLDGRGNMIEFQEAPVDGIVSSVSFGAFAPGLAVTAADLPRKVEALRADRALFERTRSRLMAEWFPEGYAFLPKAEEAVWSLIRRRL